MSIVPDEKVREIRERAGILELVADYVSLKKAGSNWQGLCPFHQEKSPSFTVNPAKGIYHCFGCGAGGDVFSFIMRQEGMTFPEALKFLAKRVGIQIEERPLTPVEKQRVDEREELYRISEVAALFYRRVLQEGSDGEAGRRYLATRGVSAETAEAYRLGFAPERWDGLVRHLESKRIPLEQAAKLGLIRKREGGGWYDLFRNRLLFTISDLHGRPIAFGGRVLDNSLPKYINSPESPIYHKSEVLFGLNLAKQAMREADAAIIVEGYFDHLALYQAGFRQVVATCGTALTQAHAQLLRRYAGKGFTLFDADSAGKKATFRAMEIFLESGFPAFAVELPAGEDPDTFLRKEGGEAFSGRLKGAAPIFDYFLRDLLKSRDTGSVAGKMQVIDEIVPRLAKISDHLQRDLYIREVSRLLGIEDRQLRSRLGKGVAEQAPVARRSQDSGRRGIGPEEMLLCLMGRYPQVARRVAACGIEKMFDPDLAGIAAAIVDEVTAGRDMDWTKLLEQIESIEERTRLSALLIADEHLAEVDAEKAFEECRRSRERAGLKDSAHLRRELMLLDPDSERYLEILKELDSLRNRKSQLH